AEDGIRDNLVTGVQTCALPIYVVHWNLARDGFDEPGPGHVMKLRYTSLQADTGAVEESDGYVAPDDLGGMPVVACALHSQVACEIGRASCRGRGGSAVVCG